MRSGSGVEKLTLCFCLLATAAACGKKDAATNDTSGGSDLGQSGIDVEVLGEQGETLPCRVHLYDSRGKPQKPPGFPAFSDHFAFSGKARLRLARGIYRYEIERGPEYVPATGELEVGARTTPQKVRLKRIADLAAQGWYSGDLHVHRAPEDVELLMRAEDLHVGPVVTWGNDRIGPQRTPSVVAFDGNRYADFSAGEDERYGGALLFFGLEQPLSLPSIARDAGKKAHREGDENDEFPSPAEFARTARTQQNVHIDIEKPFWWDVPTWLALGVADSIAIAHNHMNRSAPRNHEAWGRRCDRAVYGRSLLANGYCSQEIYYRILDTGIRLPPSAGSASGVLPNPVGYNRVYVHVDGTFTYEKWWQGLRRGQSFVTNGPLLLVKANGERPGHVFEAPDGGALEVALETQVLGTAPIRAVELVRDGKGVAVGEYARETGRVTFPVQSFTRSGWFLVRAITDRQDTFRFASTAPFYVEIGAAERRVSRAAVKYFLTWVSERAENLRKASAGSDNIDSVVEQHVQAKRYWEQQLSVATDD